MAILFVAIVYVWGLTKITEIVFYLTSTTNSVCKSDGSIVTQLNNVEIFVVKVFTIMSITGNIIQFLSHLTDDTIDTPLTCCVHAICCKYVVGQKYFFRKTQKIESS